MGFVAKGEDIIVRSDSGEYNTDYLFKKLNQDGTFSDESWGATITDFESAIVSSTWTTYGAYQYINIGLVRQLYAGIHYFNRNTRFDSTIRLSNTVTPSSADLSNVMYLTALVRGSLTDSSSTLSQRLIDEFSTGVYDYVLALGKMNRKIDDFRAINIDVNDIKTFEGSALSTKDYDLPTDEAVYLINLAICTNATMEQFTSLSINLFQEYFIEFLGDNYVTPGSVGKTQMNPDYKAERAVNNFIMTIDSEHIVDGVLIISPDYTTQIDDNTIYYMKFGSSVTFTKMSLGYYDLNSETYVASGKQYDVTISGTIANKVAVAVVSGDDVTIKALV